MQGKDVFLDPPSPKLPQPQPSSKSESQLGPDKGTPPRPGTAPATNFGCWGMGARVAAEGFNEDEVIVTSQETSSLTAAAGPARGTVGLRNIGAVLFVFSLPSHWLLAV